MSSMRNSVLSAAVLALLAVGSLAVAEALQGVEREGFVYVKPGSTRPSLREAPNAKSKTVGEVPAGVRVKHSRVVPRGSRVDWYFVKLFGFGEGWLSSKDTVAKIDLDLDEEVRRIPKPGAAAPGGKGTMTALTTAARGFDRRVARYAKGVSREDAFASLAALYSHLDLVYSDPAYPAVYQGRRWIAGTYADRTAPGRVAEAEAFAREGGLAQPPEPVTEKKGLGVSLRGVAVRTGDEAIDKALKTSARVLGAKRTLEVAIDSINARDERAAGRAAAVALVGSSDGLVLDEALAEYVSQVGNLVALHGKREVTGGDGKPRLKARRFQFGVIRRGDANAFSTPGGHVFVTTGLLERLNSEAELAFVLAHEIAHVDLEHGLLALKGEKVVLEALEQQIASRTQLSSKPVRALFDDADVFTKVVDGLVGITEGMVRSAQEPDADARALEYVISAGYDAHVAIQALDALEAPAESVEARKSKLASGTPAGAAEGKTGFERFQREALPRILRAAAGTGD